MRAPALPERKVIGLASYEIDRRSARRKCTGPNPLTPAANMSKSTTKNAWDEP
jgi:hypothetical protein